MFSSVPLSFAVPSWLLPGTAADSARFLGSLSSHLHHGCRVTEMGLCCFETEASLTCPSTDYPVSLAAASSSALMPSVSSLQTTPLALHVHLPSDLPWETSAFSDSPAAQRALQLMDRLAPHGVTRAVLHPPGGSEGLDLMRDFVRRWTAAGRDPGLLWAENHRGIHPADFMILLDTLPVNVCLDVAHALAYDQEMLFSRLAPSRVRLVHWSAPGPVSGKDAHLPLTRFNAAQRASAQFAARRFAAALPLTEIFSWCGVLESLPVLHQLYTV